MLLPVVFCHRTGGATQRNPADGFTHLAILRENELVNVRHEGKQTFYTLNQQRIVACCGHLMVKFAPDEQPNTNFVSKETL
ncbi:MAG: helix-turn-helix domain-containing protein [Chthoniobacteraceae bacterium]